MNQCAAGILDDNIDAISIFADADIDASVIDNQHLPNGADELDGELLPLPQPEMPPPPPPPPDGFKCRLSSSHQHQQQQQSSRTVRLSGEDSGRQRGKKRNSTDLLPPFRPIQRPNQHTGSPSRRPNQYYGPTGLQPHHHVGSAGQRPYQSMGPPSQRPHYQKGPPGQRHHQNMGPPGQQPNQYMGPPGQRHHQNMGPPGQQPNQHMGPPGQRHHQHMEPLGQRSNHHGTPPGLQFDVTQSQFKVTPPMTHEIQRDFHAVQVEPAVRRGDFAQAVQLAASTELNLFDDNALALLADQAARAADFQTAVQALSLLQAPTFDHITRLESWASICGQAEALKATADAAYSVFRKVLDTELSRDLINSLFRYFMPLESWPLIWDCLNRFGHTGMVTLENFARCLEAVADGRASQFGRQAAELVSLMVEDLLIQSEFITSDLLDRLWIRVAMLGDEVSAQLIDQQRAVVCSGEAERAAFVRHLTDVLSEIINRESNDFAPVCSILKCSSDDAQSLRAALLQALQNCQQPSQQLDRLCTDFGLYFGEDSPQSFVQFPCQIGLQLVLRLANLANWPEVLSCLDCLHRQARLDVPAGLAAVGVKVAVPDASLEALLHCEKLDLANQLVATATAAAAGSPGPFGLSLPQPCQNGAMDRATLLLSLARTCARRGGEGSAASVANAFVAAAQLANFCDEDFKQTAYKAAYSCCLNDLAVNAASSRVELQHAYRLLMSSTSPSFLSLQLVAPPRALRLLLCSAVRLTLTDIALVLAKTGIRSGIYHPLTDDAVLKLPADLAGEEAAALLTLALRRIRDGQRSASSGRPLQLVPLPPDGRDPQFVRLAGLPPEAALSQSDQRPEAVRACLKATLRRAVDASKSPAVVGPAALLSRRPKFIEDPSRPLLLTLPWPEVRDLIAQLE